MASDIRVNASEDDVWVVAKAIARLRQRHEVTQQQAAEAHPDEISKQYWGQHETGKVAGIVKPNVQRKLLAAISAAARLAEPLTLEDLAAEVADHHGGVSEPARAFRMAEALAPRAPAYRPNGDRTAVFPTSAGDVTLTYPADITAEAVAELEAYLAPFLAARKPKAS